MRTTVYACDRCGAEILSGRAVVVVRAGAAPPSWPTDHENGRPALDLCPPCLDALTRWLHDPAARAVESRGTVAGTGGTAREIEANAKRVDLAHRRMMSTIRALSDFRKAAAPGADDPPAL